jgi:type III secretion protein J
MKPRFPLLAIGLLAFVLAGCRVDLYTDLKEHEANQMLGALATQGLSAGKERVGETAWKVTVDRDQLAPALELLRAKGLPGERYASMGDVFQRQGLVSTPAEERMRYIHAVSQELSATLSKIDGVMAARVHVVVPANDPLSDKLKPSSAAVFIKHRPEVDLRLLAPTVKDLVAHSIEGIRHENVSLSLVEATELPSAPRAATDAVASNGGAYAGPALSPVAWGVLGALLLAGAACVLMLPRLLRQRGVAWQPWVRRQFFGWRRRMG